MGVIYIPPTDSRFYNPGEIEQFNVEVINMCVSNKCVLLNLLEISIQEHITNKILWMYVIFSVRYLSMIKI